ncbi:zinc finger protein 271-like isoform X2 [Sceloporus undulatus]|uniref:zinc finger protein 271-like isoform X2 n=1 Tax=Sceloporus undulatus TaxID=8520 RepID=UPI001C4C6513|nr:zinc finger protein 271-like isoform X2 [Sceloporus undulatus]
MEEVDLTDPKVEEVKEGATLTETGSNGGEGGQRMKQDSEEEPSRTWHAHFEEFLRTRSSGEALQQPDSKSPQVSDQGVSEANEWPRGLWVPPNQPPLIEGATEDEESYWEPRLPGKRKEGTPGKDAVGLEMQRQLFRTLSYQKFDRPQNLCRELQELCRQWLVPERHTKERMLDLVTLEQFLAALPLDMQNWLREHAPESCAQAVILAEDFLLRQPGAKGWEGQMSKEEFANLPKPKKAQTNMKKKKLLTKTKHKYNGNVNVLGGTALTGSDEQNPLHENTEETEQRMTSIKTGKENNFLCHGEPEENQQRANKANGNGKEKVEDQFVSSKGVYRSISESPTWNEENEMKYNRSGEHFSQNSHFIMHEGLDAEEKPYKCWHCEQSFSSSSALLTHERTHVDEKLYKCSYCGESERTQTGQKSHVCSHCGNFFGLNPEDKFQAGEKPYTRAERRKSYHWRSDLVKHQRTHTSGKSSRCSVCGKSFRNGSYLKLHERLHTGEKPYKCLHCGKCFTWRSHLKYHERIYTTVCSSCGKGFCNKLKRSKYGKTYTTKNSYVCSACGTKPLRKTEHNTTGHDNLLGGTELTKSEEQNPLLESTEEMEQLMTSMKASKGNNFLYQGEHNENRQRANKANRNGKGKVEDQFVSSGGVCESISEPPIWDEQSEVKYREIGGNVNESSQDIMHEDPDIAEKPYKCWHCGQSFSSSSNLLTHERTHVGEKLYKCSHCGESERTHTGQKPHKCSHCGNTFGCDPQDKLLPGKKTYTFSKRRKRCSQKSDLLKQQRIRTVKKSYKCSVCGNNFRNGSYLKIHQRIHTSEKPYKCSYCGKCFTWSSQFRLHERIHTAVCSYCGKSFSQKSELAEHEKTHAAKDSYVCFACGKIFDVSSDLIVHVWTHKEKPFECSLCGKTFKNSLQCIAHQKVHTKEKQHKCSHCGKSFSQRRGLKIHERIHKGEKSHKPLAWEENVRNNPTLKSRERSHPGKKLYKCSYCDKTFRWPSHLALHEKIHTGKKPYKCSDCETTFDRRYNLVEHMKIHSAQRSYICSDCGKSFTSNSVLLRHQKIHVGEEFCICSQCGKSFRQLSGQAEKVLKCSECIRSHCLSSNLVRKQTHAGEKPFECSVCGKTFRYGSHLISHQSVHKEVQPYQCLDCGQSVVRRPNLMVSASSQAGEKLHKCSSCEKKLH